MDTNSEILQPRRKNRFAKWALALAIVIVLNIFFNSVLSIVYKEPQIDSYCPATLYDSAPPTTQKSCVAVGGQWNEMTAPAPAGSANTVIVDGKPVTVSGSCDVGYTCNNKFDSAENVYDRNVFIALLILGILSIILGIVIKGSEAVAAGLAFGGVLSLIIASFRYWDYAGNIVKVAMLAIALFALIWLGFKKVKE